MKRLLILTFALALVAGPARAYDLHDAHFHLTNYVQEGTDIRDFLAIMGDRVGRSTLFGLPLQQTWSYANTGDFAPTYYLQSDAPLYYYSFTDATIAAAYRSLTPAGQKRFDPMITGFNPEIRPYAEEWEESETYPREIFKRMGDLGFLGVTYPEEYGGGGGDYFTTIVFAKRSPDVEASVLR